MGRYPVAAHAARRGQRDTLETRQKRAQSRQDYAAGKGKFGGEHHAQQLQHLLDAFRVDYVAQFAFAGCNADFLLSKWPRVVVEVRDSPNDPQRRRYRLEDLRARDLPVVEVFVGRWCHQRAVTVNALSYLADFKTELRDRFLDDTLRLVAGAVSHYAEHRIILGDGTPVPPELVEDEAVLRFARSLPKG